MNPRGNPEPHFVVATPGRSVCDSNARVLEDHDLLRLYATGTRSGTAGIPPERTARLPLFGALATVSARTFGGFRAESFRFAMHPMFDRWVRARLKPGDHVISSYGYANASFAWARRHGGKTFLDAGNSHPANFWAILEEEHRRWQWPIPPIASHHYKRSLAMMEEVDYVLSPSAFVTRSFLERGFRPEQIMANVYPMDLSCFQPSSVPRPASRPLTIINTGSLSLRKGVPYLLEAYRLLRQRVPDARLLLTDSLASGMETIFAKFKDLPIEWAPPLPHDKLAERLRDADIFVLPSLEDGFARTVTEALACGLPVVTTLNTGASDLIRPGVNGEIVPLRDAQAICDALLACWDRLQRGERFPLAHLQDDVSPATFERRFLEQLRERKLID